MEEEGACSVFHFLTDDLYEGESDLLFIGEEADKNTCAECSEECVLA